MSGERAHLTDLVTDRRRGQIPGQHLIAPALQHRVEQLRVRMQQRHTVGQNQTR